MMIDAEEYKIDIRKTLHEQSTILQEEQQTIMFACNLFGIDRQVYYRRIKRKINKEAKASEVVLMIHQVRQSMPDLVVEIISHING
jgi:hypothetical protein